MIGRRRIISAISVAVALLAIIVGIVVTMKRQRSRPISDVITVVPKGYRPEEQVLLPRLQKRTVVVVDRPHNPGGSFVPGGPPPDNVKRRRTFKVSTNSIGLRGPEVKVPAPGRRVICSGDSITFGWGLAYEEAWCVKLGKLLGVDPVLAAWPAARVEALLAWIEKNAKALDADLVLFTWGPAADDQNLARYLRRMQQTIKIIAPVKMAWVIPPSGTFDPLAMKNARELYPRVPRMAPFIDVLDITPAFQAALPLPGVVGKFQGDRQLMIRLPDRKVLVDVKAPPLHPEFGMLLAPEIIAAFESSPSIKEPLFYDQGHPDGAGNTLFARTVADWVRDKGWLK